MIVGQPTDASAKRASPIPTRVRCALRSSHPSVRTRRPALRHAARRLTASVASLNLAGRRTMDDRPDMQKYLDSLAPEQRDEIRAFLARFDQQVEMKTQQLLYELSDPARVSEQDLQMRDRLIAGFVPLIDDRGQLIYRKREELQIQDMQRFGRFMDADAERRKREIGDLGDSSEN